MVACWGLQDGGEVRQDCEDIDNFSRIGTFDDFQVSMSSVSLQAHGVACGLPHRCCLVLPCARDGVRLTAQSMLPAWRSCAARCSNAFVGIGGEAMSRMDAVGIEAPAYGPASRKADKECEPTHNKSKTAIFPGIMANKRAL